VLVVVVILVMFMTLVWVAVTSMFDTYLRRSPKRSLADRIAVHRRSSVADEAQRWLSER
jgi:hypothetical protein